jgi:hypothetical protein
MLLHAHEQLWRSGAAGKYGIHADSTAPAHKNVGNLPAAAQSL